MVKRLEMNQKKVKDSQQLTAMMDIEKDICLFN